MNTTDWLHLPLNVSAYSSNTSTAASSDRGELEKCIAMLVLGLGSFLSGLAPAVISAENRRRFPLTTSLLLCFGAGILLATAMVHILPEVREEMDKGTNYAEISLCAGFFIIYFIDEFIHYFFGEAIQHGHEHENNENQSTVRNNTAPNYGAVAASPLLNNAHALQTHNHENQNDHIVTAENQTNTLQQNGTEICDDHSIADANARICHTSHTEPCEQTMTGTLGLFVALSLHSAIEGVAIGVQNSATKVLFLLGAVSCHKFVMGFCLGLEFCSNPRSTLRSHMIGVAVFALGAVLGIGIGMIVVDVPTKWTSTALPVIQALAGGTLLYVTVCEVMPREKARWHQNPTRKLAGIVQFLAVAAGFSTMALLNALLKGD